jgi:phenylalanyl-tRNA synthetase beta chain
VNSAIKGCDHIRENLAPAMLNIVAKNRANHDDIRIFEIGTVVRDGIEKRRLGICIPSYEELGNIIRELFGAKFKIGVTKEEPAFMHPKNKAVIMVGDNEIGYICDVACKDKAAVAEVNLNTLESIGWVPGGGKSFASPSKYQKNHLDFTFITNNNYGAVESVFEKFKHPLNMGFRLRDVYQAGGNMSYTIQFTVGSREKTLTSDDINDIWKKIIEHGEKNNLTLKQ